MKLLGGRSDGLQSMVMFLQRRMQSELSRSNSFTKKNKKMTPETKTPGLQELPEEIEVGLFYAPAPMSEHWWGIIDSETKMEPLKRLRYTCSGRTTEAKVYRIGDRTMEQVFKPPGLTNVHDLQAVFDSVEIALSATDAPIVEGLEETLAGFERNGTPSMIGFEPIYKAARLYAQGRTRCAVPKITGEMFYMAMHKDKGAVWAANECQDLWNTYAANLNAMLSAAPPVTGGAKEEKSLDPDWYRTDAQKLEIWKEIAQERQEVIEGLWREGHKLVPIEPTPEQLFAAEKAWQERMQARAQEGTLLTPPKDTHASFRATYKAMIEATPPSSAEKEGV